MIQINNGAEYDSASPLAHPRQYAEIVKMKIPRRPALMAIFAAVALVVGGFAAPSVYAQKVKPATLDDAAKADIGRIEAYLNGIKTARTRFLQISQAGEAVGGVLTLSRPGRFRFEYDPPTPIMLVATGTFLVYVDRSLDQTTHVFLRNTPIGILVAENVKLAGDVTITQFSRGPGVVRVTLVKTTEPEEGSITLVFADAPMALRQWVVIDAQGARTNVTLDALEFGVPVNDEMFRYEKKEVDRN